MARIACATAVAAIIAAGARAETGRPERRPELPWAAAASAGPGFGFVYATQSRLALQAGRRLWGRLELDAELRLSIGAGLVGLEPALRIGVRFIVGCAELALVARGGYGGYRLDEPSNTRWVGATVVGLATEVRLPLGRSWELRLLPAACTGYLTGPLWGLALEPAAGVARRF
jgi:hypothetical protein